MIKFLGLYSFSPQFQDIFICGVLLNVMRRMEVKINVKISAVFNDTLLFCIVSILGMKMGFRNFEGTYKKNITKAAKNIGCNGRNLHTILEKYWWSCHICFKLLLWITTLRHLYHIHLHFHWFFKYLSDGPDRYSNWVNHWRCCSWPLDWFIQCWWWWNFNSDGHWQFLWLRYNTDNWITKLKLWQFYFKG